MEVLVPELLDLGILVTMTGRLKAIQVTFLWEQNVQLLSLYSPPEQLK